MRKLTVIYNRITYLENCEFQFIVGEGWSHCWWRLILPNLQEGADLSAVCLLAAVTSCLCLTVLSRRCTQECLLFWDGGWGHRIEKSLSDYFCVFEIYMQWNVSHVTLQLYYHYSTVVHLLQGRKFFHFPLIGSDPVIFQITWVIAFIGSFFEKRLWCLTMIATSLFCNMTSVLSQPLWWWVCGS